MTVTTSTKKEFTPRFDWATPRDLFNLLNDEFHFTLDVCATKENAKCSRFFSPEDDGLIQNWAGEVCWLNPPYGREAPLWVEKAFRQSIAPGTLTACLLVPRTDTSWWHDYIPFASEVRFLRGRVAFEDPTTGKRSSPQDPSCVVVFDSAKEHRLASPRFRFWDWKLALEGNKEMEYTTAA